MTNEPIGVEKCCCGHPSCSDYWLTGVGKFVQGSGFTEEEAEAIATTLNAIRTEKDSWAEGFVAGWEACDRKWEGPSAAGYPTEVGAALELAQS